jgi:hypothetical protein
MVDLHLRKDAHYPRLIVSSPSAVSVLIQFQAKLYTTVYMVSGFNKITVEGFVLLFMRQKDIWYQVIRFSEPNRRQFMYGANYRFFSMSTSFANSRRAWLP